MQYLENRLKLIYVIVHTFNSYTKLDDIVYYKYSYQYYLQNFIMVIWFIISFPVANSIIY